MNKTIISTQRLVLRPFTLDDAPVMFLWCSNPVLGNNADWPPHQSIEETIEVLKTVFLPEDYIWAIELNDTTTKNEPLMIGSVGMMKDPNKPKSDEQSLMLGYWLAEPYWGRGLMTEAAATVCKFGFEHLALDCITAYTFPNNTRSKSVLNKLGFQYQNTTKFHDDSPETIVNTDSDKPCDFYILGKGVTATD